MTTTETETLSHRAVSAWTELGLGWFDEVARRHGDASSEVQQAQKFIDETGQLYFGGSEWKAAQS